ncbi:MAG: hypothetical protein QOG45_2657 [Chloroflexota bacterium]|nr:hypothetical protein [Chloroflexota bacterium]
MTASRFEGTLEPARGGGAFVSLPAEVLARLGGGARLRVRGTLNGVGFRSSTMPAGGGAACLGVHRATREAAGAAFGETVVVEIEVDDGSREVELPAELAAALASEPALRAAFEALAPSRRRELASSVAEARREDTRARRVVRIIEQLRAGG